jgi:5-methylcytosine-specific restriction endonuclease McrA
MQTPVALLLNSTYECIGFVNFRKAFKFLAKEKVDVLAEWDFAIKIQDGEIKYPAVLRLKKYVAFKRYPMRFNRRNLYVRDKSKCQYCNKKLTFSSFTIDHVVPKSAKGKTNWTNCVAACKFCNAKKSNKSLALSGLQLQKQPLVPYKTIKYDMYFLTKVHSEWNFYIS